MEVSMTFNYQERNERSKVRELNKPPSLLVAQLLIGGDLEGEEIDTLSRWGDH